MSAGGVQQSPASVYPTQSTDQQPSKCHCTKIRDCEPLMIAISEAPKPLSTDFIKDLRKKACGYAGSEPMVCCSNENRLRRNSFPWYGPATATERPWIWDVNEDTPSPPPARESSQHNRVDQMGGKDWNFYNHFTTPRSPPRRNRNNKRNYPKNSKKKPQLFDFEDPHTSKNCPPSFSDDFEMPAFFQPVQPSSGYNPSGDIETNMIFTPSKDNIWLNAVAAAHGQESSGKAGLVNSAHCGISVHTRIIGGDDAGPGQFPWMARLAYKNRSELDLFYCTFRSFRLLLNKQI